MSTYMRAYTLRLYRLSSHPYRFGRKALSFLIQVKAPMVCFEVGVRSFTCARGGFPSSFTPPQKCGGSVRISDEAGNHHEWSGTITER